MAERKVDVAIIGAGTAVLTAYRRAREHIELLVLIKARRTAPPPGSATRRASS